MATVTVTVLAPYVIDAVNDSGGVTFPGRTVLASVLANDTLGGTPATTARVTLSTVSSTAAGLTLNAATGSVFVALGTAAGTANADLPHLRDRGPGELRRRPTSRSP